MTLSNCDEARWTIVSYKANPYGERKRKRKLVCGNQNHNRTTSMVNCFISSFLHFLLIIFVFVFVHRKGWPYGNENAHENVIHSRFHEKSTFSPENIGSFSGNENENENHLFIEDEDSDQEKT
jgi:hypothetical protein